MGHDMRAVGWRYDWPVWLLCTSVLFIALVDFLTPGTPFDSYLTIPVLASVALARPLVTGLLTTVG